MSTCQVEKLTYKNINFTTSLVDRTGTVPPGCEASNYGVSHGNLLYYSWNREFWKRGPEILLSVTFLSSLSSHAEEFDFGNFWRRTRLC
jgi:hypothetical protein